MRVSESQSLERILESAVVVSWADLVHGGQAGLIHIEYGFATDGLLDSMKFLSSISRGHWLLAVEWTSTSGSHSTGVRFHNGYESQGLKQILDLAMQHQPEFSLPVDFGRPGLLQIATPTQQESVAASALVSETLHNLRSIAELAPA